MKLLDAASAKVALERKAAAMLDWEGDRGWTMVTGSAGDLPTSFTDLVRDGFRRNAVVNAAIRTVTQVINEAPIIAEKPTPGAGPDDWERILDSPAEEAFANPNKRDPGVALIERAAQHFLIGGNALLEKVRSKSRLVVGFRAINPARIAGAMVDSNEEPLWYNVSKTDGQQRKLLVEDAILIPDLDPLNEVFGMPRLLSAALNIRTDREADSYVAEVLHNHGSPGLVVSVAPDANDKSLDRAEERWEEKFGPGRGRGKVAFVRGLGNVHEVGFNLKDLEFPELRRLTGERICAAIGVDPMLVGISSAARGGTLSGAEYEAAMQRLWDITLIPLLKRFAAYLNHGAAYEWGDIRLRFATEHVKALQPDRDQAATRAHMMMTTGVYTEQELRAETGHDPEPEEGQLVVRPLGIIVEEPGPVERQAPPPPPGAAADDDPDPDTVDDEEKPKGQKSEIPVPTVVGHKGWTKAQRRGAWLSIDAFARALEPAYRQAAERLQHSAEQDLVVLAERLLRAAPEKANGPIVVGKGLTAESVTAWQRAHKVERQRYHRAWRAKFRELTTRTTEIVGGAVSGQLGVSFDILDPNVQRFIEDRANLMADTSDDTFDAIRHTVLEGVKEGEGTTQIAARVHAVFGEGYSKGGVEILSAKERAALIARTETTAAANGATIATARATELDLEKEWINRGDDRVREAHQDRPVGVGGERKKLDEEFSNGLDHPGGDGDPSEVCNCRCGVLLIPVGT